MIKDCIIVRIMSSPNVGIIVQARMTSTRLPGKILKTLSENVTILELLLKRLKLSKLSNSIIVATTKNEIDRPIIEIAKINNIQFFLGEEFNVLERYYIAARKFKIGLIVRITSDCPFVDPIMIDDMISFYKKNRYDFIYNVAEDLTNIPIGFDIEIFSFETLKKVYKNAKSEKDKEHVTSYINCHPNQFSIFYYNDENIKKIDGLRLTIDYPEDLILCREIFKRLTESRKFADFSIHDIYEIIEKEPQLMDINKHIPNKPLLF